MLDLISILKYGIIVIIIQKAFNTITECILGTGFTLIHTIDLSSKYYEIFERFSKFNAKFHPTLYLFNGHLQTCFGPLNLISPKTVKYQREEFMLNDGEIVHLDWYPKKPSKEYKSSLLILLHGMGGGSHASYAKDVVYKLYHGSEDWKGNLTSVVFNYRGCGEAKLKRPRLYTAGDTRDLNQILEYLKEILPNARFYGAGFSIGGNILCKYLGEKGNNSLLKGAIAVGNPFDMVECSRNMKRNLINEYFYTPLFLKTLKKFITLNPEQFQELKPSKTWATVADFEWDISAMNPAVQHIEAIHGIDHYYRISSSDRWIHNIKVPTLLISAKDDPISIVDAIPHDEIEMNSNLMLMLTERGGHLGWWHEGSLSTKDAKHWCTLPIIHYIKSMEQFYD